MEKNNIKKVGFLGVFSVASVLFSSHAGGGFATGNQATQYFVTTGAWGIFSAILAMLLLAMTIRECIIMRNSRNLKSYKELFETLYHPFDKLEWIFEIYFHIMVVCAVGAVIAGAASLISISTNSSYGFSVIIVGSILFVLTIFGAKLVSKVSTIMSISILISVFIIFFIGIKAKFSEITTIISNISITENENPMKAIINAFTYAGFQSVVIPTMIACGKPLENKNDTTKSMTIAFIMNSIALVMSVIMLLGWAPEFIRDNQTTLPSLYICKQLNINILYWFYNIALLLCLISTGVTTIYGFVSRFSTLKVMEKIEKPIARRMVSSILCMGISMSVSMVGLSKIIKYGYGYCGYVGIFAIIIPFLTVGYYKNKKYAQQNNSEKSKVENVAIVFGIK
ncbi:hypothetical protein [Fusobacterium perfoetens]|uniref:hypothetical protein n=1 Tax=Fusobacterium perfoetens TaxID=852 RepID=UPI0006867C4E|nr:hypothetical protein [Fusobacterium perfoetens]